MPFNPADLAAGQAEYIEIQRQTEPLADARLEAAVKILRIWLNGDEESKIRWTVSQTPNDTLAMLREAFAQTGADDLAALVDRAQQIIPLTCEDFHEAARGALAKYESMTK